MQRFHFISGLPRSGSTLLSAILRQNPRFHAGVSIPQRRRLPPDLFEQYAKLSFWYNTASSRCNVLMVRP